MPTRPTDKSRATSQPDATPLFLLLGAMEQTLIERGWAASECLPRQSVHGSRLCLVTAHLTAHDKNVDDRNQDFHEILQVTHYPPVLRMPPVKWGSRLNWPRLLSSSGVLTEGCTGGHVLSHDSVLWCGDLNYRVELPRDTAVTHAKYLPNQSPEPETGVYALRCLLAFQGLTLSIAL
eukprot:380543-Rhodomonas_salina.2